MGVKKKKKEILVVDDCAEMREIIIEVLKDAGYLVVGAENAAVAKDLLKNLSFELMITDVDMPGINGLELARYVKNTFPQTQLIVATGSYGGDVESTVSELGGKFVRKPFSLIFLVQVVEELIKRE
ncbi:MAG: response regulator [Chitinivibrionales bacterium]|nr:response regulator [Chitinivibrionales bacterium]